MAFRDFTYPEVQAVLGLSLAEKELFGGVVPMELSVEFVARIREFGDLALAVNTEKARSEFIIAPVLLELRHILHGSFGLFSGVEFDVDSTRGLNGFCDFIISRSSLQTVLTSPVVTIIEAKNDNIRNGLGQCIAAMVAAREFNLRSTPANRSVFGVVTTGGAWKFLRLTETELILDTREYFFAELAAIMGILAHILRES